MGGLEDLLEHGGVEVLATQDVLLPGLFDLDDDGDDEEEEDDAARDADDGAVGVVQVVQYVGFPLLCSEQGRDRTGRGAREREIGGERKTVSAAEKLKLVNIKHSAVLKVRHCVVLSSKEHKRRKQMHRFNQRSYHIATVTLVYLKQMGEIQFVCKDDS